MDVDLVHAAAQHLGHKDVERGVAGVVAQGPGVRHDAGIHISKHVAVNIFRISGGEQELEYYLARGGGLRARDHDVGLDDRVEMMVDEHGGLLEEAYLLAESLDAAEVVVVHHDDEVGLVEERVGLLLLPLITAEGLVALHPGVGRGGEVWRYDGGLFAHVDQSLAKTERRAQGVAIGVDVAREDDFLALGDQLGKRGRHIVSEGLYICLGIHRFVLFLIRRA